MNEMFIDDDDIIDFEESIRQAGFNENNPYYSQDQYVNDGNNGKRILVDNPIPYTFKFSEIYINEKGQSCAGVILP